MRRSHSDLVENLKVKRWGFEKNVSAQQELHAAKKGGSLCMLCTFCDRESYLVADVSIGALLYSASPVSHALVKGVYMMQVKLII
jgi:hypothetical protein